MDKRITPNKIVQLWKKMGNRNALASRLEVSEMTIRRWENGQSDSMNSGGYRFEVERLLAEYEISQ